MADAGFQWIRQPFPWQRRRIGIALAVAVQLLELVLALVAAEQVDDLQPQRGRGVAEREGILAAEIYDGPRRRLEAPGRAGPASAGVASPKVTARAAVTASLRIMIFLLQAGPFGGARRYV